MILPSIKLYRMNHDGAVCIYHLQVIYSARAHCGHNSIQFNSIDHFIMCTHRLQFQLTSLFTRWIMAWTMARLNHTKPANTHEINGKKKKTKKQKSKIIIKKENNGKKLSIRSQHENQHLVCIDPFVVWFFFCVCVHCRSSQAVNSTYRLRSQCAISHILNWVNWQKYQFHIRISHRDPICT